MRHRVLMPAALTAALLTGLTGCSDDTDKDGGTNAPAASSARAAAKVDPAARRYVDAVAERDLDSLVDAFHEDGVAIDVGREFRGRDAIRDWAEAEVIGGKLQILKTTPKQGGTTLLVRVDPGGFEASYEFDVRDGRIARLDLRYA
ncbi:nuclear transport factor 2 family protein [Streptomyces sp. NPDC050145]|uniref:nuclear transport factor 2 family protein n=1 Tax=Streptomyces sp. NPDC050145 TaxID=3365602 RepID=UPI0037BA69C5